MDNLFSAEKELEDTSPLSFTANGDPLIAWTVNGNMVQSDTPTKSNPVYPSECGDLVESGEHNNEYVLPISCGGETTNMYLSQPIRKIGEYTDYKSKSSEYRIIAKYEFTGEESFYSANGIMRYALDGYKRTTDWGIICSHFQGVTNVTKMANLSENEVGLLVSSSGNNYLYFNTPDYFNDTLGFTAFLAEQYANGTPVTIWYVLAEAVTESIAASDIPTVSGSNTLSVGTTVQPSSIYIKYTEGGDEMVTLAKIGGRYNTALLEIRGLSTDTKPTTEIEGMIVTNGSTYIEIDTGDTYMFDAANGVWHNITG